jgi:hypothetical protein
MRSIRKLCGVAALAGVGLMAACTPPPTTTPSTTTTTTAPSGQLRFDFHDHTATVGGPNCSNCADVGMVAPDGLGHDIYADVRLFDTNQATDGGYSWQVLSASTTANPDGPGAVVCRYPLLQVRARANIGDGTTSSLTYRMDFDGNDSSSTIRDLPGTWDFSSGDRPTMYVESVTLDISAPICHLEAPGG